MSLAPETLEKAFEICGREYAEDTASSYMSKSFLTAESTSHSEEFVQGVVAAEVGAAGVRRLQCSDDLSRKSPTTKTMTISPRITKRPSSARSLRPRSRDKVEEETAAYAVTEDASAVKDLQPVQDSGIRFKPRLSAKPVAKKPTAVGFFFLRIYVFTTPTKQEDKNLWHNLASALPGSEGLRHHSGADPRHCRNTKR